MENEFYRHYKDRVVPALRERHKYKNVHQIPRVEKVVINTSVGSQPDVKQALTSYLQARRQKHHREEPVVMRSNHYLK